MNSVLLRPESKFRCEAVEELGGAPALVTNGLRECAGDNQLYSIVARQRQEIEIRAVPYHLWDNRAPGEMLVWIRREGL
ncbi:hypothetical protein DC415_23345 [Agrobacterium tumefaciens]|uniref:Non-reducing end beta-L-arabinofuranosidase-like GH127 C-terminal domain-containing protein n=1 Tax=Rhizobium rhizogenes TaxID=359 RepID=A0AA92BZG7_RHIRH|nr:hypothetical protein DC430_22210 [Rhizobium rhizogenes]PVE62238.1 hypothetical protein DC415_23345 [Agrobacterium tumefaciens]PVE70419.1 hypothetical protein DCP16_23345 [Sphingomonas sp. TPD3009]